MKAFGFTCCMGYIGGSDVVLANSIDDVPDIVNEKFKDYWRFAPISIKDVVELTEENPVALLTDGDY